MKIVAAPNAFKGSLTAREAAEAMKEGIEKVLPDAEIALVPVADGGDGMVEVAAEALGGEERKLMVTGPRYEPVEAKFCYVPGKELATVEMALASGLALLSQSMRDPASTTTFGTGELIKACLDLGAKRIAVGIGGSATNDGGIGMAQALGVRFLDKDGNELKGIGASLAGIGKIDLSCLDPRVRNVRIEAVCDVDNPLTGPRGAARIYAPQKGATPEQVEELDAGLANLADVIERDLGFDVRSLSGAGAAGGLGAGLHAFLGAELKKGIDLVFSLIKFKDKIKDADLVLTGEGRIDRQTAFDKAPAGVGAAAKELGVPCFAIAGSVGDDLGDLHARGIDAVFCIVSGPSTLDDAMKNGRKLVAKTAEQVVRAFAAGRGMKMPPAFVPVAPSRRRTNNR